MKSSTKITKVPIETFKDEKHLVLTLNEREAKLLAALVGSLNSYDTEKLINAGGKFAIDPIITDINEAGGFAYDLYQAVDKEFHIMPF